MSDDDLIERARKADDGGKFDRLWSGEWQGAYPSQSEADLALCMTLAFWTSRDAGRMDALFRRSALMREKWDRADYREATIAKAIEQTEETWKGPRTITDVDELARAVMADHYFARDAGGRLYVFKNGVYKPVGEPLVRQRVKGIVGSNWGLADRVEHTRLPGGGRVHPRRLP